MYSWIFMPVRDVIAASQDESLICRGRQRGKLAAKSISHDLCLDWVFPFFLCIPSPPIALPSPFQSPSKRLFYLSPSLPLQPCRAITIPLGLAPLVALGLASSLSIRDVSQVRQNLISTRIARQNRLPRLARRLFLYARYSSSRSDQISAWKSSRALEGDRFRTPPFYRPFFSLPLVRVPVRFFFRSDSFQRERERIKKIVNESWVYSFVGICMGMI